VRAFEEAFSSYRGGGHTVALMSCTHALEMSLRALGVGAGDEVITTAMTFVATANAIEHAGATPVFVDALLDDANIDPAAVEAAITPRTRAIMPVHMYGVMCDMRAIADIAERHDLRVVEDAAHCVEGERDGVRPGDFGDTSCYSFYATKNLTCGEGGAVSTADPEIAEELRRARLHGMTSDAADRYSKRYRHWDVDRPGMKANLSDVQGAMLLGQLRRIEESLARREELARRYEEAFRDVEGIDFPRVPAGCKSARHLFTIWVAPGRRDELLSFLHDRGIGAAVNYRAVPLLRYYRDTYGFRRGAFPVAERIGDATVSLPLYPKLRDDEAERVIAAVREFAGS